jgi:hypothetical protein
LLLPLWRRLSCPGPALARECGIPDSSPLWVDFAGHDAPLPQKPGLTLAFTSGTAKPAEARAAGAATVFFDLNFNNRVGTPTVPPTRRRSANGRPALRLRRLGDGLPDAVDRAERALRAQTPTPWTATTAQYRAQYAGTRSAARGAGSKTRGHDRQSAVHGGRRGTVVA